MLVSDTDELGAAIYRAASEAKRVGAVAANARLAKFQQKRLLS
jgi:hypothetical protein